MRLPGGVPLTWHLGLGREIGFIFWGMIMVEASFGAYVGIWPLWIEALGAPITVVGFVLGSSGILRLFFMAPSASLADRFNPTRLIVLVRLAAAIGLISAGLAMHWTQLVPMIIGGALGDVAFPLVQAQLARLAGDQRVRAFTLVFNVGPAVAFGIAPLLSAGLIALYGMRAAFIFAGVCSLLSVFMLSRIPSPPREDAATRQRSSYREALAQPTVKPLITMQFAVIFALGLGISLLATFLADQRGISPAIVAVLGGVGSAGAVVFGLVIARSTFLQKNPMTGVVIGMLMVMAALAVILSTHMVWLIALAFIGRGGLWSAWGLFGAALSEVVEDDRVRPRVFTLSEMLAGSGFSTSPIVSGQLYAIRPELPLLASMGLSALLIPVILVAQRRIRPRTTPKDVVIGEAMVEPEAA
ncbi:MAG: MFS transporter [Chloroflexota bacterium]|nr:MFS transporter [Chloroflexota bacterium]